ncbi:MAG: hypothetical protein ABI193_12685, partial [Minicystis sp.]
MVDAGDKSGARRKQLVGGGLTLLAALLGYYFWDDHHPEGTVIDTPMVPASIDPQRNDPTKDPPASPERAAILKDLKVGSVVSGWTIAALTISTKYDTKDALAVVLVNGKKSFAVWILPRGQSKIGAQFGTANYVLHTGLLT